MTSCPRGGITENELLTITASLESASEHPLGQAILAEARARNLPFIRRRISRPWQAWREKQAGQKRLLVGNQALLDSAGIPADVLTEDGSAWPPRAKPPWAAIEGQAAGLIAVA